MEQVGLPNLLFILNDNGVEERIADEQSGKSSNILKTVQQVGSPLL